MRILFVTPTLGHGGSERLTIAYARGMSERGHDVSVAFGYHDLLEGRFHEMGVPTLRLSERNLSLRTLAPWTAALRRAIRSVRPDVVHAQSVTAAIACRVASPGTPLLVTIHGIREASEATAAAVFRVIGGRLTAVSEAAASGLERHRLSPPIDVVISGIDVERFESAADTRVDVIDGEPLYCCVARLEPVKGVDVLLRAMPEVLDVIPGAALVQVGAGTRSAESEELIASLGIGARVQLAGFQDPAAPFIGHADVVVLPSRREALPVVVLEAFALRKPVIATNVGGTPTLVIDGETGWLVPPDDPHSLAEAMIAAAHDPAERDRRGRAGRRIVEARFTEARMLDRVESLLRAQASRRTGFSPVSRPHDLAARAYRRYRASLARLRAHERDWEGVRIFGYHRIADERHDPFAVSRETFRAQLETLRASDVTPIRLDEATELLEAPVQGRYACITFDDGYADNLENAVPILEALEIPATIFAVSEILSGRATFSWYRTPPRALTWEDVPALLRGGLVDVQAHSRTHPRLPVVDDASAFEEIAGSRRDLEARVPYAVTSFCYPGGLYGAREIRLVEEAGYKAGLTTRPGINRGGTALFDLRRTMLFPSDTRRDFECKLAGALDAAAPLQSAVQRRRARVGKRERIELNGRGERA